MPRGLQKPILVFSPNVQSPQRSEQASLIRNVDNHNRLRFQKFSNLNHQLVGARNMLQNLLELYKVERIRLKRRILQLSAIDIQTRGPGEAYRDGINVDTKRT